MYCSTPLSYAGVYLCRVCSYARVSQKALQNILELDSLINTAVTGSVIMVNK